MPISQPKPQAAPAQRAPDSHQAQHAWFEPWGRAAPWGQYSRKAGPLAMYPIAPPPPLATAAGCSDTCHRLNQFSSFSIKWSETVWPSSFLLQTQLQWIQFQLHLSTEICLACLILLYLTSDFSLLKISARNNVACLLSVFFSPLGVVIF